MTVVPHCIAYVRICDWYTIANLRTIIQTPSSENVYRLSLFSLDTSTSPAGLAAGVVVAGIVLIILMVVAVLAIWWWRYSLFIDSS